MCTPLQVFTVSEFMEEYFGYYYHMRWWCVLILAAYILFVRIGSIIALKYCECRCQRTRSRHCMHACRGCMSVHVHH